MFKVRGQKTVYTFRPQYTNWMRPPSLLVPNEPPKPIKDLARLSGLWYSEGRVYEKQE